MLCTVFLPIHRYLFTKEALLSVLLAYLSCQHHYSRTLGPLLSRIHTTVNLITKTVTERSVCNMDCWTTGRLTSWVGGSWTAQNFITLLRTEYNLSLMDCLFLELLPWITMGSRELPWKVKPRVSRDCCIADLWGRSPTVPWPYCRCSVWWGPGGCLHILFLLPQCGLVSPSYLNHVLGGLELSVSFPQMLQIEFSHHWPMI